ncbi:MAG: hypothetical protein M3R72_05860 [Bacteroidota bacterium]|nr:hypothetical protein [Bacteroidota bacterium]
MKWIEVADEPFLNGLLSAVMNNSRFEGEMYKDYYRHKPILGKVKVKDFAKGFAVAYNG